MANQGILWQLVSNIDPLGQYTQGLNKYQQQQNVLEQLAGQREDRQYNQQRDARDFQFRQTESDRNQSNWQQKFLADQKNAGVSQSIALAQLKIAQDQFARGEVPQGYERDPNNPTQLRPRIGGPADPQTIRNNVLAQREPVGPQYKEVEVNGSKTLVRINPDGTVVAPEIQGVSQTPINPYAPNGKMTQDQATAALYADRMHGANQILNSNEKINQGFSGFTGGLITPQNPNAFSNFAMSTDRQKFQQAERDLINAILRKESGAVIGESEFQNARKQYIPQPGDSDAVIQQKRINRETALRGFFRAAGPHYKPPQASPVKQDSTNQQDPLGIR